MQAMIVKVIQFTMDEAESMIVDQIMSMAAHSDRTSGAYSSAEQKAAEDWLRAFRDVTERPINSR
jgi:hypothetical protein